MLPLSICFSSCRGPSCIPQFSLLVRSVLCCCLPIAGPLLCRHSFLLLLKTQSLVAFHGEVSQFLNKFSCFRYSFKIVAFPNPMDDKEELYV